MSPKIKNLIVFLSGVILGFVIFYFSKASDHRSKDISDYNYIPDTVYVGNLNIVDPYKRNINPYKVEISKPSTPKGQIKIISDTIHYYSRDTIILYNPRFLNLYPESDKLIQLLLDKNNLKLNLLSNNGLEYSKTYPLDLSKYEYNYSNNSMTIRNIPFKDKIKPYTELTYRPFHNLWDIDLGVKYNTSRINYKVGVNFYYYHSYNSLGADLFIKFSYQF